MSGVLPKDIMELLMEKYLNPYDTFKFREVSKKMKQIVDNKYEDVMKKRITKYSSKALSDTLKRCSVCLYFVSKRKITSHMEAHTEGYRGGIFLTRKNIFCDFCKVETCYPSRSHDCPFSKYKCVGQKLYHNHSFFEPTCELLYSIEELKTHVCKYECRTCGTTAFLDDENFFRHHCE